MKLQRLLVPSLITLLGCSAVGDPPGERHDEPNIVEKPEGEQQAEGTSLDAQFQSAADEFGVPASILKSISWVETSWNMVVGEEEFEGMPKAYGLMALRGDNLHDGAALAGVTIDEAANDPLSNIRTASALMSSWADELDIDREALGAWAEIAAMYSGIDNLDGRAHYIHEGVFRILQEGMVTESIQLPATEVVPHYVAMAASQNPGPDYEAAIWRPSPNHSARPSGSSGDPQMVIVHTCEGSYAGCWSWLNNSSSGVSAHYVVNNTGSEVSQLVTESRKAWHIGATYACSRNSSKHCELNGKSSNNFTIGIEHAGFSSQSSWNAGLLDTSSQLTCDIAADNGISIDPFHIVGHGQLQPFNRTDPGAAWPWGAYISAIDLACNGGGNQGGGTEEEEEEQGSTPGPALDIVVDSNNAANPAGAQCVVTSNWTSSSNVSGYYNTGYWWRSTGSTTDLAEFRVNLNAPRKMIIEAWWSSASDRSTTAPFLIFDGNGNHIDTVHVNQQQNGGQWVTLGTYDLTAGWNSAALSRWTTPGKVVVADAVRFRDAP